MRLLLVVVLGFGALSAVHAAEETCNIRPLVGLGVTGGGATLATVKYTDGTSSSIHAGGLAEIYAGVDYRAGTRVSMQATAGYHVDNNNAKNGSLRFARYPIELLGYYHANERWRFGGGVRFVNDPHISGSGILGNADYKFNSTTGAVIEGEFLTSVAGRLQVGVKLRYVVESYQPQGGGVSVSGNHAGLFAVLYF